MSRSTPTGRDPSMPMANSQRTLRRSSNCARRRYRDRTKRTASRSPRLGAAAGVTQLGKRTARSGSLRGGCLARHGTKTAAAEFAIEWRKRAYPVSIEPPLERAFWRIFLQRPLRGRVEVSRQTSMSYPGQGRPPHGVERQQGQIWRQKAGALQAEQPREYSSKEEGASRRAKKGRSS